MGFWDSEGPQTTVTHSALLYTTAAPSRANPADILAGLGALNGPKLNPTGIGGRPAWEANGTDQALRSTSFAFPAAGGAATMFFYALMRVDSVASGFNGFLCGGVGVAPSTNASSTTLLTAYGGGAQTIAMALNTPKRLVQRHGPQTGTDFVQWGAAKTIGNMGAQAAQSGMNLFVRGDLNAVTYGNGALAFCGIFSGDPATGNLLAQLDAWGLARYGATNWGNYTS